jgi:hypothetical protein
MPWLPSDAVRARYGGLNGKSKISYMTLTRWVERGLLPPPTYIGGRKYWSSEQLDEHDRLRAAVAHEQRRNGRAALVEQGGVR